MGSESPICWEGREKEREGKGEKKDEGRGEEKEEQREGEE